MDYWKERMQAANEKWLARRTAKYPIRVDLPEEHANALEIANELNVAFAHCKLPLTANGPIRVFLFENEADAARFREALGGAAR